MVSKLKTRKVRKKHRKRPPHSDITVRVPAWLTRCATMGYEVWSDKPERVPASEGGSFKVLVGWEDTAAEGSFYFRLPLLDAMEVSPVYLREGGRIRIWLNLTITGRRKLTHAEGSIQLDGTDEKNS